MKHSCIPLLLFFLCFFFSNADSQTRQYERKSVTSLGAVLFKTTPAPELVTLINNRLKAHLEVSRFDYNALSGDAASEFVRKANATDLSSENIQRVLEETIVPKITRAVNAVAEERAKGNLTEEDIARAAVDKMKGSGLTAEDIKNVMNSAYLYLPIVTDWNADDSSSAVEGYVAWYRIRQNKGNATIEKLKEASTIQKGNGSGNPTESYRLKNRSVNGTEFAKIIAINTWAKNLAVAMKNISAFQLGGEVKNVDGNIVEVNLGKKEGVGLDDGYDVLEDIEDSKGNIVSQNIGFVRADKVADNITDNSQHSRFKKYIGGAFERGIIIRERARLGIDIAFKVKQSTIKIPKELTVPFTMGRDINNNFVYPWKEDVTSSVGIVASFALNIAKMTQVRQLFFDVDVFLGTVSASQNTPDDVVLFPYEPSLSTLYGNIYTGITDKFWFGRMNLAISAKVGGDVLWLTDTKAVENSFEELRIIALGAQFGAGFEYLVSPDWIFNMNVSYKIAEEPAKYELKIKGEDKFKESDFAAGDPIPDFSGISFSVGLSFALPSLEVDPFAGLTAKDIDY
jgi:hypothetical protein